MFQITNSHNSDEDAMAFIKVYIIIIKQNFVVLSNSEGKRFLEDIASKYKT